MLGDLPFKGRLQGLGDLASWVIMNLILDISTYYRPSSLGLDHLKQVWIAEIAELLMHLLDEFHIE